MKRGADVRIKQSNQRRNIMAKEKGASFSPDTFSEGGGLLDNVDVTWEEVRFELWDYDGKIPTPTPAMKVRMKVEDQEEPVDQYFSAGNPQDWTPSKDGTKLVAIGRATGINKTSNLGILMTSLLEAKFPADKMEGDDCTVFEGLKCHMVRVKAPERKGLAPTARADGRVFDKTNLVVDRIIKLPWEKKGTTSTTPKGGKNESEGDDVGDKTIGIIQEILEENPKGVNKKKLAQLVLEKMKGDPDRNTALKLAYSDKFLSEGPWEYEDGVVK